MYTFGGADHRRAGMLRRSIVGHELDRASWPVDRVSEEIGGLQSVVWTAPPHPAVGTEEQSASQNA